MMESSPAQLPEHQNRQQVTSNSGTEVSIHELLATIGELHVSNRRLLIRVEQLEQQLKQSMVESQKQMVKMNDNNNQIGAALPLSNK